MITLCLCDVCRAPASVERVTPRGLVFDLCEACAPQARAIELELRRATAKSRWWSIERGGGR